MFFGREMKEVAVWVRRGDAVNAMLWVSKQARGFHMIVGVRGDTTGFAIVRTTGSMLGAGPVDALTKGYIAALMQRHDKPPVLEDFIGKDDATRRRDMADVPFMGPLMYYDVLPKERAA